jgi:hypothetical protein
MPLINLQTNLKSLRYGADRQGGGDSGLPYIQTNIENANPGIKFDDGLVRGGAVNAAVAGAVDTARIAKFLIDPPKGPLFIVKQIGLQLANPRLEVPKNPANIASGLPDNVLSVGTNGLLQPTRIYNLGINTLAQIPVNAFGIHFNRHGLLPVQSNASKYEAVVTANNDVGGSSRFNRLVGLTNKFKLGDRTPNQTTDRRVVNTLNTVLQAVSTLTGAPAASLSITPQDLIIDQYAAGPNSVYGIGRTTINRYYNSEDSFKINLLTNFSKQYAGLTRDTNGAGTVVKIKSTKDFEVSKLTKSSLNSSTWRYQDGTSLDNSFLNYTASSADTGSKSKPAEYIAPNYINDLGKGSGSISQYPGSKDEPTAIDQAAILSYSKSNPSLRIYAELQKQVETDNNSIAIYSHAEYVQDTSTGNIPGLATDYNYSEKEKSNFQITTPDSRDNRYPSSSIESNRTKTLLALKRPIFDSELGFPGTQQIDRTAEEKEQFIYPGLFDRTNDVLLGEDGMKLIFTPIQPFTGVETQFQFLGYLNSYDESYDSGWGETRYVGRAESFYVFNSFKRTANISFTVPCFNREELLENHRKLFSLRKNTQGGYDVDHTRGSLAYALAGQYSEDALLGGVIIRTTVGNYLNNTPGIINSLKFDIVDSSPWDLDEKLVQYIKITVTFTIIGDQLPIYENVAFVVRQTDETLPEDDNIPRTARGEVRGIPQSIIDNTRNTSDAQRRAERQAEVNRRRQGGTTATGQPTQTQQVPPPGQNLVLSNVLGG